MAWGGGVFKKEGVRSIQQRWGRKCPLDVAPRENEKAGGDGNQPTGAVGSGGCE